MNALVHSRRKVPRKQGYMNLLVRTATHLKTVVLRTPVNERLGPTLEAVSDCCLRPCPCLRDTPHREGTGGRVLVTVDS